MFDKAQQKNFCSYILTFIKKVLATVDLFSVKELENLKSGFASRASSRNFIEHLKSDFK